MGRCRQRRLGRRQGQLPRGCRRRSGLRLLGKKDLGTTEFPPNRHGNHRRRSRLPPAHRRPHAGADVADVHRVRRTLFRGAEGHGLAVATIVSDGRHDQTRVRGHGRRRGDPGHSCERNTTFTDAEARRRSASRRSSASRGGLRPSTRSRPATRTRPFAASRRPSWRRCRCSSARRPPGRNFIISHEPTFYGHTDSTAEIESDPIYQRKAELIKKHDLVVWRFHDHWHMRRPEPMTQGFYRAMGWEQYRAAESSRIITIPETTVGCGGTARGEGWGSRRCASWATPRRKSPRSASCQATDSCRR